MTNTQSLFLLATLISGLLIPANLCAKLRYNGKFPQVAFAAGELKAAVKAAGREELDIMLVVKPNGASPEGYRTRWFGENDLRVVGNDPNGTMYGALEIAEHLRMNLPIENKVHEPYVKKRGIKWNIPLDARVPSYDDTGDSAQRNIENVWDFAFWQAYLDQLARYRYNVLSLWATHPFPCLIKLDAYPDVALDDVYRITEGKLTPTVKNKWQGLDIYAPGNMTLVKELSIEEKIQHWQRVFQYAEDRGIEIYLFFWNVFTWYADGKYGITQEQDNPRTVTYIRACVTQLLESYPQIDGIGVTTGENADWYATGEHSIERFIFNTYGKAIMDVRKQHPERQIRFICRRHTTEHEKVTAAFKDYTGGIVDTSIKYSVAHTFASRRPQEWETRIVEEGWLENYKAWLNLRNDDIFMHRWGSADYARDFIKWMPHEHMRGFYLGSDGYVWAREVMAKNPAMAGRLEIDKHWYQFRLWGQLSYDIGLDRGYWETAIQERFPEVDARQLYDAWAAASEIVPQLNRASWSPTDAAFSAEGCIQREGFLTIQEYYFNRPTMPLRRIPNPPDPQCISVTDWAKAYLAGRQVDGVTPMQVADNLDGWATQALELLPALRAETDHNIELEETLNDIETMAWLGRYYADKQRGAAKLALFRESGRSDQRYIDQAVAHLEDAVKEWETYAKLLDRQYNPTLLARTNYLDWWATLEDVKQEVITIRNEGDFPEVAFVDLKQGSRLPAGSDLKVRVNASDRDGLRTLTLRLNGQLINAVDGARNPYVWSNTSDRRLKGLQPGVYDLHVLVEDNTGIRSEGKIQIAVGDASMEMAGQWKNDIYQVILKEGERIEMDERKVFQDLGCYLTIDDEGSLLLMRGLPGNTEGFIWKTRGKADRPTPQPVPPHFYATMKNGRMQVIRSYPGKPEQVLYETRAPSQAGDYKLGITAARRLVVFANDNEGGRETTWMTPMPD